MNCPYDDPDCFQCPFDECVASGKDISRQLNVKKQMYIIERNNAIVNAYKNGVTRENLVNRFKLNKSTISRILRENNAYNS